MLRMLFPALLVILHGCAIHPRVVPDLDDAPDGRAARALEVHPESYDQALRSWHSPEQVNTWIGDTFEYDRDRAIQFSETQRRARGTLPVHAPDRFFTQPSGVCVDLARFAVETLQAIAPEVRPRYLMLEFDPVTIRGHTLRRHWLVSFERDGKFYFFADSKRPGRIEGPYASTGEFVTAYARYRGREVVSFRELPSYQRRAKVESVKRRRDGTSRPNPLFDPAGDSGPSRAGWSLWSPSGQP
jgi:hypothetical protein